MRTNVLKSDDGYVGLFAVAMILVILSLLLMGIVVLSPVSHKLAVTKVAQTNALYAAESGVNYALTNLDKPNSEGGHADDYPLWRPNGTSQVWIETNTAYSLITVQDQNPAAGEIRVSVRGYVSPNNLDWTWREIEINAKKNIGFAFDYAMFSNSTMDINKATIDGDIFANGSMTVGNQANIDGGASATGSVTVSGNPTITEGTQANTSTISLPTIFTGKLVNQARYLAAGSGGEYYGDYNVGGSVSTTLPNVVNGNLTITSSGQVLIDQVVYVTGDVNISGSGVHGSGCLIANGTIYVSGGVYYQAGTSKLALITLSTANPAFSLSGNAHVDGLVYAPYGTVSISGNPNVYGGLIANGFQLGGHPAVNYDPGMRDGLAPIFEGPYKITSWEEK